MANEVLKDLADMLSVGTGPAPLPKIFSMWIRVQQFFVDVWGEAIVADAMTCINEVSARAGEPAFQPRQPVAQCRGAISASGAEATDKGAAWVDNAAWETARVQLDQQLADYVSAAHAVSDVIRRDAPSTADDTVKQMDAAQSELNDATGAALALLSPPIGEAWTEETRAAAEQLVRLELESLGLHIGITSLQAETDSETAKEFVQRSAGLVSARAAELRPSLKLGESLSAAPAAVPRIAAVPADPEAVIGQTTSFDVRIQNVGSATATGVTLTGTMQGQDPITFVVPAMEAGQSVDLRFSFTPSSLEHSVLLLELSDGRREDFRLFQMSVLATSPQVFRPPMIRTGAPGSASASLGSAVSC